ncbi:MAG: autotransporter-associated beta strand repeat-containing protein [Thermoguttaceae bacterium]
MNNATFGGTVRLQTGTLDLYTMGLQTKPIVVQGAGAGGNGAIVNNIAISPAGSQYTTSNVTLSGDTTFGAGGSAYALTKVGNNQIMLVGAPLDSALGSICVNQGVLSLEGTAVLSNTATPATANASVLVQSAGGSILQLRNLTASLTKNITLRNNGQLYDLQNPVGTDGTIAGTITFDNGGGTLSGTTLALKGSSGVINSGAGTITLSNNNSFTGATIVSAGTLQVSNSSLGTAQLGNGTVTLSGNVTYAGAPTINASTLQFNNSSSGTLTIGNTISGTMNLAVRQPSIVTLTAAPITVNQSGTLQVANNSTIAIAGIPASSVIYGGLTKIGAGTLTVGNNTTYAGSTTVVNTGTLQSGSISGSGAMTIASGNLTIASGAGTLQYGSINGSGDLTIVSGSTVQVNSINTSTLTIGAGATLTIAALPGGPVPGAISLAPVDPSQPIPEPSVMVMLSIAILVFIRFGLRSKNSTVRP